MIVSWEAKLQYAGIQIWEASSLPEPAALPASACPAAPGQSLTLCEGRTRMISQTGASFSIELLTTCTRLGSALHLGAGRGAAGSSSLLREQ